MRRELTLFVWVVSLSGLAVPAMADVPRQMNVQGILTDTAGVPRTGDFTFTFEIFTLQTGGTKVWPALGAGELQPVATDNAGRWTVQLGTVDPLTDDVFAESDRWLQITVNDGVLPPMLLPRVKLNTTPFAFRALYADSSASVQSVAANGWTDEGAVVRLTTPTDYVGIGTATPSEALVVGKDLGGSSWDYIVVGNDTPDRGSGIKLGEDANNHASIVWGNNNNVLGLTTKESGSIQAGLFLKGGKLGVGTESPGFRLEVKSAGTSDGLRVTCSDGQQLFRVRESSVGSCEMYVSDSIGGSGVLLRGVGDSYFDAGNVGIGTTSPAGKLHVVGSGNSSVQLPTNAISRSEILDEPGVAYTEITDVLMPNITPGTLITQSVDFPSTGYALVLVTVWAYAPHNVEMSDAFDVCFCISDLPNNCGTGETDACATSDNVDVPLENYHVSVALQKVIPITMAGNRQFYLVGWANMETTWVNIYWARMSVLFFPTWYGNNAPPSPMAVNEDPVTSSADSHSALGESTAEVDDRIERLVNERVYSEAEKLRTEFEAELEVLREQIRQTPVERQD